MLRILVLGVLFSGVLGYSQILPSQQAIHYKKNALGGFFSVRTFTNCGKTGRTGPSQSDCNTAYASTGLNGEVTLSGGIQSWTVPATGTYTIIAYGAKGGGPNGGDGAKISGQFSLTANEVIKIVVGQKGSYFEKDASGGGGTFVTKSPHNDNSSIIVVAGGGGGSFVDNSTSNGQITTAGADGCCSQSSLHSPSGGTNGNGTGYTGNSSLIGGAGFLTNGIGPSGTKSQSYLNGGAGANNEWSGDTGFGGGFGGGGDANRKHASTYATAGGGGYSGGGVGYYFNNNTPTSGGGGGSYNNGSNISNVAGNNSGHGKVEISW
tara:strand:+ start:3152 stop:4114 length:963 start_codon:yes stop_codon:yes gene_type:complete